MIKAVFFDLYNTLGRFDPPREEMQAQAIERLGLVADKAAVVRAYPIADDFMAQENQRLPLRNRSPEERDRFFTQYQRLLLRHAGLDVPDETALQLFQSVRALRQGFVLFDDALPTLAALKAKRYVLGLLSNLDEDVDDITRDLGLSPYLDFALSSRQVGVPKPHPRFFEQALGLAKMTPEVVVHVGDQYRNDVQGARGVGIHPVLLDREGHNPAPHDCPRISTLTEVIGLVEEMNRAEST